MPVIIIETTEGKSEEQKRRLAKDMAEVVSKDFNVPLEWVQIIIHELSSENRANAGELGADSKDKFNIIS